MSDESRLGSGGGWVDEHRRHRETSDGSDLVCTITCCEWFFVCWRLKKMKCDTCMGRAADFRNCADPHPIGHGSAGRSNLCVWCGVVYCCHASSPSSARTGSDSCHRTTFSGFARQLSGTGSRHHSPRKVGLVLFSGVLVSVITSYCVAELPTSCPLPAQDE